MLREASFYETVWRAKPELKRLWDTEAETSLRDYFDKTTPQTSSVPEVRKREFLAIFRERLTILFGEDVATKAALELEAQWFVSTADHHGPLCHPFFLNTNLVQAFVNRSQGRRYVPVLSVGDVSLNNSSFPRGIFLHDAAVREVRVPFISLKHRHHPVFGFRALGQNDASKVLRRSGRLDPRLVGLLQDTFLHPDVLRGRNYSEQISRGNLRLWRRLPETSNTELLYIEMEPLVIELLLSFHLVDRTAINRLIFDPEVRQYFLEEFNGVQGAFDTEGHRGTFLFWSLQDGERQALALDGSDLVSANGRRIKLTPPEIETLLRRGELIPSMALSFVLLSFYYGLACGGGFSQINYLGDMRNAYRNVLRKADFAPEADLAMDVPTNIFRGELVLAAKGEGGSRVALSAMDLALDPDASGPLEGMASRLSLRAAISDMMPEYYKIITGSYPHDGTLSEERSGAR